jgi:aminoglycoside 2''-phosphotransferase
MLADDYQPIIAACFPDLAIERCRPVAQGWDSVAVAVNNDLIFRFPKRREVEPQYALEARLLPALASALPLPIPDVAFLWPGGATYPNVFIGHHLMPGVQLAAAHLAPERAPGLAQQLGQFLSALHRFPKERASQLGVPKSDQAGWRRQYQEQYAQIQGQILPLLALPAQAHIADEWRAFLADQARLPIALIHHDLNGEHILYDPARSAISGIIDWGDSAIGDPAIDFAGLLADYGEDFTEGVLSHYQCEVDRSFRDRVRFYCGAMPLNSVLFGLATGQAEFVSQGLKGLCE